MPTACRPTASHAVRALAGRRDAGAMAGATLIQAGRDSANAPELRPWDADRVSASANQLRAAGTRTLSPGSVRASGGKAPGAGRGNLGRRGEEEEGGGQQDRQLHAHPERARAAGSGAEDEDARGEEHRHQHDPVSVSEAGPSVTGPAGGIKGS